MAKKAVEVCYQEAVAGRVHGREVVNRVHDADRDQPAEHVYDDRISHGSPSPPGEAGAGHHGHGASGGTPVESPDSPVGILPECENCRARSVLDLPASVPQRVPGDHRRRKRSPLVGALEVVEHVSLAAASHRGLDVVEEQSARRSCRSECGLVYLDAD